ncbi:MAG: tryptophan-rich sensory protein [Elusimicrobiaceae bacterium]|nr:tryptophan-rich sensory protein [Elusimicrobiaceae bacterium]
MKIIILAIIFLAIGGMMSASVNSALNGWFSTLEKPFLNPPNYVFMPVWTILYVSLAIFVWMIDRQPHSPLVVRAKRLFVAQLVLNFFWTPIFFGLHSIIGGLIILVVLDYLVFRLISVSFKINKVCAFIILPYFLWILFATYLNISIFLIN